MSKYFGLWYGGYSYSPGTIEDDLELFDSIEQAKDEMWQRYHYGRLRSTRPNGTVEQTSTPFGSMSAEIQLWASDPRGIDDPYPDMRVYFGPRGGVRVEKL